MRLFPPLLVIALVVGVGNTATGLAANPSAARGLAKCAEIESAVERLDCYDRLARDEASQAQSKPQPEEDRTAEAHKPGRAPDAPLTRERKQAESAPDPTPARSLVTERSQSDQADKRAESKTEWFGKDKPDNPAADLNHIKAHIESVRKTPLGHHVMTLSNGQVWMENEPGRRGIANDQDVTIRKHRWHFEMELDNRPNVTVRRVK